MPKLSLAAAFALASLAPAFAQGELIVEKKTFELPQYTTAGGATIKGVKVGWESYGQINAERSNVVLVTHFFSATSHAAGKYKPDDKAAGYWDAIIGPGKAIDTTKYFVVATDAIGNGLTTSPSNSALQPRTRFPRFAIRDMVESQRRLLVEHLGINRVAAVVGPSMGGMQALQWGVSHPDFMDALVALVPLARTPAWTAAVLEASRKAVMLDPAWRGGDYTAPPEGGVRLWRDILTFLAARSPEMYRDQFAQAPLEVLPWLERQEASLLNAFDANDWIYQTWAYEQHDLGTTPGMDGDLVRALGAIRAKTLILTGTKDLLNPEYEPQEAARHIRGARVVTISPGTVTGHASTGASSPPTWIS
jgi:homoserine O-acetyltransferase/O-succinyltransferase